MNIKDGDLVHWKSSHPYKGTITVQGEATGVVYDNLVVVRRQGLCGVHGIIPAQIIKVERKGVSIDWK